MRHLKILLAIAAITLLLVITRKLTTRVTEVPHAIVLNFRQPIIHSKRTIAPSCKNLEFLLKTPGAVAGIHLESKPNSPCIVALYGKNMASPDINGQIIFPRLHAEDEVTIVITKKIKPIMLHGKYAKHFIGYGSKMVFYKITRKQETNGKDATEKATYEWEVKKINPPADKIIPPLAIILLAESKKLCIQEGTIGGAVPGGNFMLPPIFVTEKLSDKVCISALKIAKDYLPMRYHYTHATNRKQCAKTRKAA